MSVGNSLTPPPITQQGTGQTVLSVQPWRARRVPGRNRDSERPGQSPDLPKQSWTLPASGLEPWGSFAPSVCRIGGGPRARRFTEQFRRGAQTGWPVRTVGVDTYLVRRAGLGELHDALRWSRRSSRLVSRYGEGGACGSGARTKTSTCRPWSRSLALMNECTLRPVICSTAAIAAWRIAS